MTLLSLRIAGSICVALLAGAPYPSAAAPLTHIAAIARNDVRDLGRAPASTAVSVAVTLGYRNAGELDALVDAQAAPGSPLFRHFLTPNQFAAEFAPTPAQYADVAQTLHRAGFRIVRTYANRVLIDAVAAAPVAERFFSTQIDRVAQAGHGIRYANVTPAQLPAAFGGTVDTVLGLDNVVKFTSHRARAAIRVPASSAAAPSLNGPIERIANGAFAGLYPTAIAKAYNYPTQRGAAGTGHALAIVIDSDIANSDLAAFWKGAGITRTGRFSRVYVDGANPGFNSDGAETAIDTEMTSSLAPGADIDLYLVASLNDAPIEDAYNLAVSRSDLDVVSSSFGGCELDDIPFAHVSEVIALQGAAVGVTFTASTGDSGSWCEDETANGEIYFEPGIVANPASNPHFVAVGGTTLQVNPKTGARVAETAWGPGGPTGGGGGGVSSYWPLPAYQHRVRGMTVVPSVSVTPPATPPNTGFHGRNLPDISLDASNDVGCIAVYDTYPDSGWTAYGGTSVSNPVFAALLVDLNDVYHARAGFVNPLLYAAFTNHGTTPAGIYGKDFYDVTRGGIGAFAAKPGYDQATGIGSIFL